VTRLDVSGRRGRSENGVALITVLWALILLSIIAAAVSLETRSSARVARNMVENAAARAAADAGIQRAILDLKAMTLPGPDPSKFRADGTVYAWRFANCTIYVSIQDEGGKIDLNQAPEALLTALFASVGVAQGKAESLADAIADYRDADNLRRPGGAEEADYQDAGLGWGPKNAPFQTVEELQQVLGVTPEIYRRVAPDLTVYAVGSALNPTTASERLTGVLHQSGLQYAAATPGLVFSIRAKAQSSNGGVFVREAVLQRVQDTSTTWLLSWRQGS
jgi:general secretion pathway protein K